MTKTQPKTLYYIQSESSDETGTEADNYSPALSMPQQSRQGVVNAMQVKDMGAYIAQPKYLYIFDENYDEEEDEYEDEQ